MKKILIIDDDADLLHLIEVKLKQEGFSVRLAENGQEGLKLAAAYKPDAIILDIIMPGMRGWEVCQQLRKTSNVPILILSSKTSDDDVIRGLGLGVDEYLTKPFRLNTLSARLNAVIRRANLPESAQNNALQNTKEIIISALQSDIRTPIARIYNALELVIRNASQKDNSSNKKYLLEARENTQIIRKIITDLQTLVRIEDGLELVLNSQKLLPLLQSSIKQFQHTIGLKNVDINVICPEDLFIEGDISLLTQAIQNIFISSFRNTPYKGQTAIIASQTKNSAITIDFHGPALELNDVEQELVFIKFYQPGDPLSWNQGGLGIELHNAREIARAHRGNLNLHSKIGEGSTFRLALPSAQN